MLTVWISKRDTPVVWWCSDLRKQGPEKNSQDSPFKSTAGPGKISLTPIYPEKGFMVPVCRATKPSAPYFYNILYKIVIDKLSYFIHQKVFSSGFIIADR